METDQKILDARLHMHQLKGFLIHAFIFTCVMSGLIGLNILTKSDWWVQWPLFGWGIGLLGHAVQVFTPLRLFGRDWEERKIRKRLGRMQH